ncbi:hypothetical protein [Corynebacterium variabile]|uniref:hypothetical protein n=1 Tax=Corynebacterium variabile TaxID=1727 RepID=UPI003FD0CFEA
MAHRLRRRHGLRYVTLSVSVFLLVLGGAWTWFAVTRIYAPRLDPVPEDVDVIVQLGGIPGGDYQAARELAEQLGVPDLVLSNPIGRSVQGRYCGPLAGGTVHCFTPAPSTTRGEAREFAALAYSHGWRSAYVMGTGREHTERVRWYFARCWDGELAVNAPTSSRPVREHVRQGLYQTAGWLKAVTYGGC